MTMDIPNGSVYVHNPYGAPILVDSHTTSSKSCVPSANEPTKKHAKCCTESTCDDKRSFFGTKSKQPRPQPRERHSTPPPHNHCGRYPEEVRQRRNNGLYRDEHTSRRPGRNTSPVRKQTKRREPRDDKPKEPVAVCLDHLKGICSQKRWKCKFAHPTLKKKTTPSGEQRVVCEVWVLTGFCKFGDSCRDWHPPQDELCKPMCAKTITAKMLKKAAVDNSDNSSEGGSETISTDASTRRASDPCISDEEITPSSTPPATPSTPPPFCFSASTLDKTVRKVNGILNRLTPEKFDVLLQQMFELLNEEETENCMQRVLPLIFAKAAAEPQNSEVYARLWKALFGLVGADDQPELREQMLQLCNKLIFEVGDVLTAIWGNDEAVDKLRGKRLGHVEFIGQLFTQGLLTQAYVQDTLTHLLRSCRVTGDSELNKSEAQFSVELVCKMLGATGREMEARVGRAPISRFISLLKKAVQSFPTRQQVLCMNMAETFEKNWINRYEVKPKTLAEIDAAYQRPRR